MVSQVENETGERSGRSDMEVNTLSSLPSQGRVTSTAIIDFLVNGRIENNRTLIGRRLESVPWKYFRAFPSSLVFKERENECLDVDRKGE